MINNGTSKIEDSYGGLNISIPSKISWFALIPGTAWPGGWYFGFSGGSSTLSSGEIDSLSANGFMTFWLIGWTIGGVAIVSFLL